MTNERVEFTHFITKAIKILKNDSRRIFEGHITAEIIDKQQEFMFVSEVMKIMDTFMAINPVLSEVHTNRMIGKVLGYEKSEINGVASVKIKAEIYKHDKITLYDKVWAKIVSGEYSGLSMGGASKEREPMMKDGRWALELRKLELYEIAVCPSPANSFAIIDKVNTFAKLNELPDEMIQNLDGRNIIKCGSIGCYFEKGTNIDVDKDTDNTNEHLEQFDKPAQTLKEGTTEDKDMEKHHQVGLTDEKEYKELADESKNPTRGKLRKDGVEPNADHISPDTELPCVAADNEEQAKAKKDGHIDSLAKQTVPHDTPSGSKNDTAPSKEDIQSVSNKENLYKNDVYSFIKDFGLDTVRKAIEEIETREEMLILLKRYQ